MHYSKIQLCQTFVCVDIGQIKVGQKRIEIFQQRIY